jgi:hypothetical protein
VGHRDPYPARHLFLGDGRLRRPLLKPDHRGIIINGPYRYTNYPAHFVENLAWWLVSVPWLADSGTAQALRCVALMPLVSSI